MPRQNILVPVTIILVGLFMAVLFFSGQPSQSSIVAAHTQAGDLVNMQAYPNGTPTPESDSNPYPATTETAQSTASSITQPTSDTSNASPTATIASFDQTATPMSTPTESPSPETSPAPTSFATPTVELQPTAPVDTPTPINPNLLACSLGQPLVISGVGPPLAGFLLVFNDRPVSGGSVGADGRFAITLIVGNEQPGDYSVVVRLRGTPVELRRLQCTVPPTTPTPVIQPGEE